MAKKLLEGIKIADFSRVIVGPLSVKTLCDYGAEVIKIEGKSRPGHYRTTGPEPDLSAHFTSWNTGKLSIALNLTLPEALEVAKKIVAWADIVLESFAGGAMVRMGLGYEVLKQVKPDIIMLSTCMQGQTGPFYRHPGWGFQLSGLSGFNNISGWPDREPPELGVYTDFVAPNYNVSALLAALLYRRRTGKGMYIDMSQYENAVQFMSPLVLDYTVNGRIAGRTGNRSANAVPHNAYRCLDRERRCSIGINSDEDWRRFCEIANHPEWADDARFGSTDSRKKNRAELDGLIESWTISRSVEEIKTLLKPAEIAVERPPAEAVHPVSELQDYYRCLSDDRWCAISVSTDEEWENFCRVIGSPAWTKDPKYATFLSRKENEDELDVLINEWTADRKAEDVMSMMQAAGVAAGVLVTGDDQLEYDPQLRHRRFFREVDHPRMGVHHPTAHPFKLSKIDCEVERAPLLAEHNEYILKEILGYSDEEIAQLVICGAVE